MYKIVYLINGKESSEQEWEEAFKNNNPCIVLTKQYIPIHHTLNLRTTECYSEADRINLLLTNDDSIVTDAFEHF